MPLGNRLTEGEGLARHMTKILLKPTYCPELMPPSCDSHYRGWGRSLIYGLRLGKRYISWYV